MMKQGQITMNDARTVSFVDYGTPDQHREAALEIVAAQLGWGTFDLAAITCPVIVLHGSSDNIAPVAHAHHTAAIVPGATLCVIDDLGHFSAIAHVVGTVSHVLTRPASVVSAAPTQ